jgi:DNA-binding transcriptional LysR family regulator
MRFESRFPGVQIETRPSLALQALEALGRHEIDVAILPAPFPPIEALRYMPLGELEIMVALPDQHRLARLDAIPRGELLHEPILVWPRSVNPTLIDHFRRSLFGESGHPCFVEIFDFADNSRLQQVAQGRGIAMVLAPTAWERFPDIVFRRIEDPAPTMEIGLAWFDLHVSSFVPSFVDLAGELSRARD